MQVPVGYVSPPALSYSHAQVNTPLTVKLIPTRAGGYELRLAFQSRVALDNAQSAYDFIWYVPGTRNENDGNWRTESDIAAGQTVSTTTCPLPTGSDPRDNQPLRARRNVQKQERTRVRIQVRKILA